MPTIRGDADAFLRGLGLALETGNELTERQSAVFDLVQAALDYTDAETQPGLEDASTFCDAANTFLDRAADIWAARWSAK